MKKIKLFLVDDHQIVRSGLKALLLNEKAIEIVGEASTPHVLFQQLKVITPDIIILDIRLPGQSGIEVAKIISKNFSKIKIIMLTANIDENCIISSLKAGANGFLSKETSKEEFVEAIYTVFHGDEYIGGNLSKKILNSYLHQLRYNKSSGNEKLSDREIQITKLFAEGLSFKEIGEELCISARTVETHKKNILEKLGLRNTIDLVKYAIKNNLIEL